MNKLLGIVIGIILVASFLRIFNLHYGDPLGDEADYGFRSYGYLDYQSSPKHPTPLERFDTSNTPSWLNLSYHDAPPLFFLVQHISFKIFGENTFSLRLPSALFGIGTVILTMFLGKILYNIDTGILAGLLLTVSTNHIYISRVGMLESMTLFFILLSIVFYRKALKNDWNFLFMGLAVGIALMTKYTAVIAPIIIGTNVLFFQKAKLKNYKFWIGVVISLLIFFPVILYNYYLYKSFGHFDYALMNLLGPIPNAWEFNPGREVGTISERIVNFVPQMFNSGSWFIIILTYFSFIIILWKLVRNPKKIFQTHRFLFFSLILLIPYIIILEPAPRFLVMAKPFFAIATAYTFNELYKNNKYKKLILLFITVLISAGIIYAYNTFLTTSPLGIKYLTFSPVHFRQDDLGYVALDNFFQNEFENRMPAFLRQRKYEFLNKIAASSIKEKEHKDYSLYPAVIMHDPLMEPPATLFVLGKLYNYHGWPVLSVERYLNEPSYKNQIPINTVMYYIGLNPNSYIKIKLANPYTEIGRYFELILQSSGIKPIIIYNRSGIPAFHIYKWNSNQQLQLIPDSN